MFSNLSMHFASGRSDQPHRFKDILKFHVIPAVRLTMKRSRNMIRYKTYNSFYNSSVPRKGWLIAQKSVLTSHISSLPNIGHPSLSQTSKSSCFTTVCHSVGMEESLHRSVYYYAPHALPRCPICVSRRRQHPPFWLVGWFYPLPARKSARVLAGILVCAYAWPSLGPNESR